VYLSECFLNLGPSPHLQPDYSQRRHHVRFGKMLLLHPTSAFRSLVTVCAVLVGVSCTASHHLIVTSLWMCNVQQ
jgi:hypothetical protein